MHAGPSPLNPSISMFFRSSTHSTSCESMYPLLSWSICSTNRRSGVGRQGAGSHHAAPLPVRRRRGWLAKEALLPCRRSASATDASHRQQAHVVEDPRQKRPICGVEARHDERGLARAAFGLFAIALKDIRQQQRTSIQGEANLHKHLAETGLELHAGIVDVARGRFLPKLNAAPKPKARENWSVDERGRAGHSRVEGSCSTRQRAASSAPSAPSAPFPRCP